MYLVKQKHPIAERHGNTGVLEKHSWSMAFTLLDMEEYDPLHHLPKQRREGLDLGSAHFVVSDRSEVR
jgi:hypothetical protein